MDIQTMLDLASKNDPRTVDALVELGVLIEDGSEDDFGVNWERLAEVKAQAFDAEWAQVEQIMQGALAAGSAQ